MNYKELRSKADSISRKDNDRRREGYYYARSLGFTARESTLLQFKPKEEIDRIAKERDTEK